MDKEQLLMYLKDIQKFSTYPIIIEDPISHYFVIKSGGTKQEVYSHMVLIRERINIILDYFFDEEFRDGQQ